jgi:hypothetical protein
MLDHELFVHHKVTKFLNKTESELLSELEKYCDAISNTLSLTKGMNAMLVLREDENGEKKVYFVYNQCLDTSHIVNCNVAFKLHNPSLNIDTHIFKPTPNAKHPANKYFSWERKKYGVFHGNTKLNIWK